MRQYDAWAGEFILHIACHALVLLGIFCGHFNYSQFFVHTGHNLCIGFGMSLT
jgi:hypothetical protein